MWYALSTTCLYMNRKVQVACNFNFLFATEVIIKVTGRHVHCQCGNITETVQDGVILIAISNGGNSDDLEWPSRSFTFCKPLQLWFFVQLRNSWQDVNWHTASRCPSAIAEVLVKNYAVKQLRSSLALIIIMLLQWTVRSRTLTTADCTTAVLRT